MWKPKKYPTLEETGIIREAIFNKVDNNSIVYDLSGPNDLISKGRGYASCKKMMTTKDDIADWKGIDCVVMNCWTEEEECDRSMKLKRVHIYQPERRKKILISDYDRDNIAHIKGKL